jgi:hypothetical protein
MEKNHSQVECKGCGFPIVWITSKAGKHIPCDPEKVSVVTEDGDIIVGRVSHWATCPAADTFRKK